MTKNKFIKFFTAHPEAIGETYVQHLFVAAWSGIQLLFAGIACIIHSIFPFLFVNTASNTVKRIHANMTKRNKD
jgi:phage-related protein